MSDSGRISLVFKDDLIAFSYKFFAYVSRLNLQHKLQNLISRMSVNSLSSFKETKVAYNLVLCNYIALDIWNDFGGEAVGSKKQQSIGKNSFYSNTP